MLLGHSSCTSPNAETKKTNKIQTDTLIPPVSVSIKDPIVVKLDTCLPPAIIKLSTKDNIQTILLKNGRRLNLEPPEVKPADFLSLMQGYTSDDGLPIDMMACGKRDKKGNLWFGTVGGGVSRYDGKTFVNFTMAQGLAHESVWSIMEDKNENIWIGTYGGGVSRYDGKSFVNFTTTQGLKNNYVLSILEDRHGNMWFGTRTGISRYDGQSFFNYTKKQGLVNEVVWTILEDRKGNLWFGTNGGVSCYNGKSFITITTKQGLLNNIVRNITEDTKGNLWFETEGGISCYANGAFINYTTLQGLAHNNVRVALEDNKGNLWFGTFGGGVSCYNGKTFTNYTVKQGLINDKVVDIIEDKTGNVWFLTLGGVCSYEGEAFTTYTVAQGMSSNLIYGMGEDKKGNLWLNSGTSGMECYDGKNFISYGVPQGFPNSPSTCIQEGKAGNIWFGTYSTGISCFDGKSITNYTVKQGLISNAISTCIKDKMGNLWFGSLDGGVSCYDGKSFINYAVAQGLVNNPVLSMIEDHRGRLWIGTEGGGITCYDGKFYTNYSIKQGLPNNNIRSFAEDKTGNLWIATDGGISRFDGKSFLNYAVREGLPDKNAMQIAIGPRENIVIGTNKGIAIMTCFTKRNQNKNLPEILFVQNDLTNEQLKNYAPVFEIFNSATGYPVKDVNSGQQTLYKDSKGILWIATGSDKTALVRFDYSALRKKNNIPKVYIQGIRINGEIICWSDLDKTDTLQNGNGKNENNSTPVNVTEEVTSYGIALNAEERDLLKQKFGDISFTTIGKFYPIPENLVLPYKNNSITFDFTAIEPAKPYLVNYQYQLQGYDDDWSVISNKTTVTFGNIYEGTYVFKVKAQEDPAGLWSEPITFTFKVLPPLWRTWWMYSIYGALAIGLVVIIVRWNSKRLRARAKELALEIRKATQEIVDQKKIVEEKNKIVEEKNKIVEEKNKSITDSINYALRIQKAFLPKKEQFYSHLPKSFILFKPKDIVSGDFYFFHKTFSLKENAGEGLLFIAAVDCTGHGVPGAFLSMVGSERLTDAVQQSDNASEILSLLNKGVKNSLHQTGEDESTRDGMDIAICSLDVENRIVKYAGANRPLWLIRKGKDVVEEIKSTKVSVGGLTEDDQHFESHELKLQEGDTFYIFSDGYADIFSGASGKKLTTKKFRQLLLDIQNKTMQEQEHYLERFIEDWKAGTEQIDDILVIGIRF
jgi:ligand-binding sensor domain-containing protein/serine phosphatase RsbU (regulator of sigma subunit)